MGPHQSYVMNDDLRCMNYDLENKGFFLRNKIRDFTINMQGDGTHIPVYLGNVLNQMDPGPSPWGNY